MHTASSKQNNSNDANVSNIKVRAFIIQLGSLSGAIHIYF